MIWPDMKVRVMAIEHALAHARTKPWGIVDLRPWSSVRHDGAIGEIWYDRPGRTPVEPSLLLKLLFTSQPLSIQVHPNDADAHSIGLANGKTEAWYILSAVSDAKIALGLDRRLSSQQLRDAINDGTIAHLAQWKTVLRDDTIFVPAGTIHAIGAGVVIAEIQQRSDTTYRLFDYGRQRELHVERAIAVADAGPSTCQDMPQKLTDSRTLLVANAYFVFEKIELAPYSTWRMQAERETWLLVIGGKARVGSFDLAIGEAIFALSDCADIQVGPNGMVGLVAYTGGTYDPRLLQRDKQSGEAHAETRQDTQIPSLLSEARAIRTGHPLETMK
jgi:mannose-6-phosphate isomerase